ncbi:energy transducer TonB [Puniceicoccaceae bacterium K14]|nr:energy transducer TonB [Puniceicoccaceae bacterium K14]
MSTNYKPSDQNGSIFSNGFFGALATLVIFMILPAMHILGQFNLNKSTNLAEEAAIPPPPPPPEELPPPPEEQEEVEEPEMEEPPPPMTLAQLEMALNPGQGGAMGDFGFNDFDTSIDAAASMEIFNLNELDQHPRAVHQIKPVYPYAMKQASVKGWVKCEWVIEPSGKCSRVRAVESSHREFEQPAIDAIIKSKWKPGRKDSKDVATRVSQRISFTQ